MNKIFPSKSSQDFKTIQTITATAQSPFSKNLDGYYIRSTTNTNSSNQSSDLPDINNTLVQFNIDGKTTYGTIIGFCLSIIAIGIIILAFTVRVMTLADLAPTVQIQKLSDDDTNDFDSSSDNFFMRISFYNDTKLLPYDFVNTMIRQKIFAYKSTTTNDLMTDWGVDVIEMDGFEKCPNSVSNMTNLTQIQGHFDTDRGENWKAYILCSNPSLGFLASGSRFGSSQSYFSLSILPCEGHLSTCEIHSLNTMYSQIKLKLEVIYQYIQVGNYTDPVHYAYREIISSTFDPYIQKNYNVGFKQVTLNQNYNMLWGNFGYEYNHKFATFDYTKSDYKRRSDITDTQSPMINVFFEAGYTKEVVTLSYMQILGLFENVGGTMGVVLFGLGALYTWHNSIKFEQEMLNKTVLYQPENTNEADYKNLYFGYWFLFKMYFRSLCCCCCQKNKKLPKKEFKYNMAKQKMESDMNIITHNHRKDRSALLEKILIKPYQMKLISMAHIIELDQD